MTYLSGSLNSYDECPGRGSSIQIKDSNAEAREGVNSPIANTMR